MFRRLKFVKLFPAREWLAIICGGGVCFGLLLAWLQKSLGLDPRLVRLVLLIGAAVLLLLSVLLLAAYVKELRREEEEWAGRDEEDGGRKGKQPTL